MDLALLHRLQEQINYCFNSAELRALCFELGIEYDDLPGQRRADKVTALIDYFVIRDTIVKLTQTCQRLRPNFAWDDPGVAGPKRYNSNALEPLRQKLLAHLDADALKAIVQSLGLDPALLTLASPKSQARELILYLARRGQIPQLLERCARQRPDVPWQNFSTYDGSPSPETPASSLKISSTDEIDLARLRHLLLKFKEGALRDMCFTLGTDYDGLEGGPDKTRAIVQYFERRGMTPTLISVCSQQRPDLPWESILTGSPPHPAIANRPARRLEVLERPLQHDRPPVAQQPWDLQQVFRYLDRRLDMHQLRDLCFDVGVDYATLDGDNKSSKIRALVVYLSRRKALDKLVQARPQLFEAPPDAGGRRPARPQEAKARHLRPGQDWASMTKDIDPNDPVQLVHLLEQFTVNEIQMLCDELGMDYDDLRGGTRIKKIRELVLRCHRVRRGAELVQACARLW